ncbi:MAG: hypothetical protein WD273_08420 [Trueperaceae bacterium]
MGDACARTSRAHGVRGGDGSHAPARRRPLRCRTALGASAGKAGYLRKAAAILNEGERVAILVGVGALRASAEVIDTAETLGAGVAKALLGKAALPDDLPFVTGSIGLLGTKPSWDLMMECDTLLMVGSSFPYSEFLPKEGQARGVQIDIDPGGHRDERGATTLGIDGLDSPLN